MRRPQALQSRAVILREKQAERRCRELRDKISDLKRRRETIIDPVARQQMSDLIAKLLSRLTAEEN
jgi:hypothetical protein